MSVTTPDRPVRVVGRGGPRAADAAGRGAALLRPAARPGSPRPCSGASSARDVVFPYPELSTADATAEADAAVAARPRRSPTPTSTPPRSTARPTSPQSVIDGLAELGVLGMTAPPEFGGRGFSQSAVLPDHGGHRRPLRRRRPSSSTPTTRSASGPCSCSARPSRRRSGCRRLARGEKLAAFALTEERGRVRRLQRPDDRHARAPTARRTSSTAPSATSPTAASPTS